MGKATLEIKGFDEFYEKLLEMEKNADRIAEQKFDECLNILEAELKAKANGAGVPAHLTSEIVKDKQTGNGRWTGKVGWKSDLGKATNPLSTFYKIIFLNYGTPKERHVDKNNQRLNINGDWVTLGTGRGVITGRGFIQKAKTSAKRKTTALMKKTLKEMLKK